MNWLYWYVIIIMLLCLGDKDPIYGLLFLPMLMGDIFAWIKEDNSKKDEIDDSYDEDKEDFEYEILKNIIGKQSNYISDKDKYINNIRLYIEYCNKMGYVVDIEYVKIQYIRRFMNIFWEEVLNDKGFDDKVLNALGTYIEHIEKEYTFKFDEIFDMFKSKDNIRIYLEKLGNEEIDKSVEIIYNAASGEIYNFINEIEEDE